MPRFHIRVRTTNPQEDLALLRRANLKAEHADDHIDVFVEADNGEAARQQVSRALGRDHDDADFVETEPAGD
jgi:hypothetical protein